VVESFGRGYLNAGEYLDASGEEYLDTEKYLDDFGGEYLDAFPGGRDLL